METYQGKAKKRPGWVWVISIFIFFSAAWTLLSFYLIYSGAIPLQPEQKAYFARLTSVDYSLTILLGITNLIGAVALFFLRRIAFYLFVGVLVLNSVMTLWHVLFKDWATAMGGAGLFGMLIGYGLIVAVCLYAWKLKKSGVLI